MDGNLAYALNRYDEVIHDEEDIRRPQIRVSGRKAATEGSAPKIIAVSAAAFLLLFMFVYGKVEQAAIHTEINRQTRQVDILHSENVRMRSEIEGKSSIRAVEDYAENILGMIRLENSQIEYISIENGNVIQIPETDDNFFVKIKNNFYEFIEHLKG